MYCIYSTCTWWSDVYSIDESFSIFITSSLKIHVTKNIYMMNWINRCVYVVFTRAFYYLIYPGMWKHWTIYWTFWPIFITLVLLPIYMYAVQFQIHWTLTKCIEQCPVWLAISISLHLSKIHDIKSSTDVVFMRSYYLFL